MNRLIGACLLLLAAAGLARAQTQIPTIRPEAYAGMSSLTANGTAAFNISGSGAYNHTVSYTGVSVTGITVTVMASTNGGITYGTPTCTRLSDSSATCAATAIGGEGWTFSGAYNVIAVTVTGLTGSGATATINYAGATKVAASSGGLTPGVTPSSFTQGSIVFAGTSGLISQDNANFNYSDTTKIGNYGNRVLVGSSTLANVSQSTFDGLFPGTVRPGMFIGNTGLAGTKSNSLWLWDADGANTNPQIVQVDSSGGSFTSPSNGWGGSGIGTIVSMGYVGGSVAAFRPYTIFEYGASTGAAATEDDVRGKIQFRLATGQGLGLDNLTDGIAIINTSVSSTRLSLVNGVHYRQYNTGFSATYSGENANFERTDGTWASNVFSFGPANGGTGVLRAMNLTGSTVNVTQGPLNLLRGTSGAPTFTMTDSTTGFYRSGSNQIGFTTAGQAAFAMEGNAGLLFANGYGVGYSASGSFAAAEMFLYRSAANTLKLTSGSLVVANGMSFGTVMYAGGLTAASGTPHSLCINNATNEVTRNAALTCTVSARDQKTGIAPLRAGGFESLKPVSFRYIDQPERERFGFIADDAQSVNHALGDAYTASNEARSIDTNAILALTVKKVQELEAQIALMKGSK